MTEQEKRVSSLKDNIAMAMVALIRNLDSIVAFDARPMQIVIESYPYQDSNINFYRFNPADKAATKSEVSTNEQSEDH